MVFGHSWKTATSSSSSSSATATASNNTMNNNNNPTQARPSWMSPSSSPSTSRQQQQQHLSPADAGAGLGGGGLFARNTTSAASFATTNAAAAAAVGGAGMTPSVAATTTDFDSLLVNSATLLSSMGRDGFGTGGGSASMTGIRTGGVGVGGRTMMMMGGGGGNMKNETNPTTTATSSYEAEAAAHRLLAREGLGFDSADLGRRARELERRVAVDGYRGGDLNEGGGIMGSSSSSSSRRRRSLLGWDDEIEEEKKSSGRFLSLDGMNGYDDDNDNNNDHDGYHHPHRHSQPMTLQELLSSHHNYCVESAIRTSRERAAKLAQQQIEERLHSDWLKRKQDVLGRGMVGHRFLLGGSGSSSGGVTGGGCRTNAGIGNELVPIGGDGTASGVAESFVYSGIVPSPQIIPSSAERLVKSHLSSIHERFMTTSTMAVSTTSIITFQESSTTKANAALLLLTSLEEGLKDVALAEATTEITPECLSGYANAFALIRSILNCHIELGLSDAPTSSTMMLTTTAMTNNANNDVAPVLVANVLGTCHFFAQQFASHVREMVQEAELGGWAMSSSLSASTNSVRDICAFATLTLGKEVVEGRGGIWPRLFYCLRCGDVNAANFVLKQLANVGGGVGSSVEDVSVVDPDVTDLVSQLSSLQQNHATIFFQNQFFYPTQSVIQSRRRVADLYERVQMRSKSLSSGGGGMGEDSDPCLYYRDACLAMLGGSESISEAPALESSGLLVKTVEDYLYTSLWHALHVTEFDGAGGTIGGSGDGGLRGLAEAVSRLSVLINQWGPSYFEQDEDVNDGGALYTGASDAVALATRGGGSVTKSAKAVPRSGGWAYALPLLASQQYATALAYLAEAGGGLGLLQAAHVGIVMDVAGLRVTDFTVDELSNMSSKSSQQALLPMLVASYSASLQGLDAGAALRYLALMTGRGKFVKEQVQRLILETRQFDALAGKIEASGSRSNGALDAHFTKSEVSSLLVDSANHAIRVGKPADAAELLVLAGRFGALFSLLNRELASYLNATSSEGFGKRQFWFNAASQFHAVHLARGRTYVQNTLDAEGNMSLGNTFQLLMNLMVFFDRCRENQWEGAWALMDDLQLMPRTESEMTVRVEAFRALDNCVRQVFHRVVLAAMEALCHIYNMLKQGRVGVSDDQHNTTDQSLNEIRTRARLLVTFARLLNLPSLGDADTYIRISQLEKNMM